jgi:hypothetical protein
MTPPLIFLIYWMLDMNNDTTRALETLLGLRCPGCPAIHQGLRPKLRSAPVALDTQNSQHVPTSHRRMQTYANCPKCPNMSHQAIQSLKIQRKCLSTLVTTQNSCLERGTKATPRTRRHGSFQLRKMKTQCVVMRLSMSLH